MIATAFFAHSTNLLTKIAEIINKPLDAIIYGELYEKIIGNFRKEFITSNGRLAVPTQTAHVLALMFDLVEGKDRERIIKTLVDYIKGGKAHLKQGLSVRLILVAS